MSTETDDETPSEREVPRPPELRPSSSGTGTQPEHGKAGGVPQDCGGTSNNEHVDMAVSTSVSQETCDFHQASLVAVDDKVVGARVVEVTQIAGSHVTAAAGASPDTGGWCADEESGTLQGTTTREGVRADRVVSAGELEEVESGGSEIDAEDVREHRYVMPMPMLMDGNVPPVHPSLGIFAKAEPPSLIEEESESGSGDSSNTFSELCDSKPRQLSISRRASVSIHHKVGGVDDCWLR